MKNTLLLLRCLSVIKKNSHELDFRFEGIDIMIICHSVLSILLELKSRNSEMLGAVCICLSFIVCGQYLLFLFSLMKVHVKSQQLPLFR